MSIKNGIFKYKKVIMLALIIVSVVICVAATYITEYNLTKVNMEEIFSVEEIRKYKSANDFYNHFEVFRVTTTSELDPVTDDKTGEIEEGNRKIAVYAEKKSTSNIERIYFKMCIGADWVGVLSSQGSNTTALKFNQDNTIEINGVKSIFPVNGKLWFVTVTQPKLYVLAKWSENNTQYYTYLEFDYNEYGLK